jgi:hypothetical protein
MVILAIKKLADTTGKIRIGDVYFARVIENYLNRLQQSLNELQSRFNRMVFLNSIFEKISIKNYELEIFISYKSIKVCELNK